MIVNHVPLNKTVWSACIHLRTLLLHNSKDNLKDWFPIAWTEGHLVSFLENTHRMELGIRGGHISYWVGAV